MRWRFADQDHEAEMAYRLSMTEKIDAFWRSFEENIDAIKSDNVDNCIEWVTTELPKVRQDLMWELSPEIDNFRRFVITPESNYFLHPMVATMIERAPKLKGFHFMSYREPVEAENVEGVVTGRTGQWISDVQILAAVTDPSNAIDLVFVSPEFNARNSDSDVDYCYVLCEVALGQRIMEEWIRKIETRSSKAGMIKQIKSFLRTPEKALSEGIDVMILRKTISALRQSILDKLPEKPHWQVEPELTRRTGGSLLEFKNQDTRRVTCATFTPDVILGIIAPPMCFTSERFSRCGDTFCYLKIDESTTQITDASLDRTDLEDAFDTALRKASVGCVTGGGSGPVFSFIDFALADVEAAIPVLREVSAEVSLPKPTWLRFLDAKLEQEWVGMYADTPEPDMSPGW